MCQSRGTTRDLEFLCDLADLNLIKVDMSFDKLGINFIIIFNVLLLYRSICYQSINHPLALDPVKPSRNTKQVPLEKASPGN